MHCDLNLLCVTLEHHMTNLICIGVPYFLGKRLDEPSAVTAVSNSGFAQTINAAWVTITPDYAASPDPITAVNRALSEEIMAHRDSFPVIFASDCISSIGAVKGLTRDDGMGIVWLDAHGDFNTPETTPSGFLGGMPLAMLVGRGETNLLGGVGLSPLLEEDVILTDARSLDPGEAIALQQSAVRHLPDIHDLSTASLPAKSLYIHLDIDVVNPDEMPAMGYPAAGGASLAEIAAILQRVARDGRVAGLLIALWNQSRVSDNRPLQGALQLARAFVDGLPNRRQQG
jgi:arginase